MTPLDNLRRIVAGWRGEWRVDAHDGITLSHDGDEWPIASMDGDAVIALVELLNAIRQAVDGATDEIARLTAELAAEQNKRSDVIRERNEAEERARNAEAGNRVLQAEVVRMDAELAAAHAVPPDVEDDARSWRNAIEGAKEPGDPVLRAIAELLSCTYLDAVPTPADDDIRRELAVAARIANDERRAKLGEGAVMYSEKRDAAKWRRVEPLIERLRVAADADTSDTIHVVDAAIELLAAAKEPS